MLFERLFNRFKSMDEWSFKYYVQWMKNSGDDELVSTALEYEAIVPALMSMFYPKMEFSDIEKMKWKNVKYRVTQMEDEAKKQSQLMDRISEMLKTPMMPNFSYTSKYGNSLVNLEANRWQE